MRFDQTYHVHDEEHQWHHIQRNQTVIHVDRIHGLHRFIGHQHKSTQHSHGQTYGTNDGQCIRSLRIVRCKSQQEVGVDHAEDQRQDHLKRTALRHDAQHTRDAKFKYQIANLPKPKLWFVLCKHATQTRVRPIVFVAVRAVFLDIKVFSMFVQLNKQIQRHTDRIC